MDAEAAETNYKVPICDRIPTIKELEIQKTQDREAKSTDLSMTPSYIVYRTCHSEEFSRRIKKDITFYRYCLISVCLSFVLGLLIGIVIMSQTKINLNDGDVKARLNSPKEESRDAKERRHNGPYSAVSFTGVDKYKKDIYPKGLTEGMREILKDNKEPHSHALIFNKTDFVVNDRTVLFDNIFWGPEVENSMPQGYGVNSAEIWESYVNQSEIIKMENGCGRMQNRLVTFKDGVQACVRYRQNTDQIQGEIFSFYVAKLLNLTNLAPSVVKIVDLKDKLWGSVANDVASAQWNSNRAVVLTQYIPSLESAKIPDIFKPSNRHLNKNDILEMSMKENESSEVAKQILIEKLKTKNVKTKKVVENFDHIDAVLNKKTVNKFVELAQWSDLIIFDYLTANLDRIVNNLFNFQWNVNIMDGPAHNLARKMDSGLLVFLDNESGLLHGYRLLKKYNVYHSVMLDNLCVFRKTTVEALKRLHSAQNVGLKLSEMFHEKNSAVIRDILPALPEKNAKVLHERISRVLSQVDQCESNFAVR